MYWKNISLNLRRWNLTHQCHCQSPQPQKWQQTPKLILRRYRHTATAQAADENHSHHHHNHNPYPYPTNRNPTPHQLFHLPRNATKAEIKARYYDLVRVYHPDKVHDDISPDVAQSRFQAITAAYDVLRGKTPLNAHGTIHPRPGGHADVEARHRSTAAYRAMRQRRQELYSSGAVDDTTKDRLILAGVVLTIIFVIAHTATTRREALAEALNRSRNISAHYPFPPNQQTRTEDKRLSLDASKHEESEHEKSAFPHS